MTTFSNFKSTLVAAADTAAGASAAATTIVADMAALIALTGMSDGDQAFVTANNNLYFYSSGWYKIATVSNDSPSSITGVSGSYALDTSGGTTTITAVSTDPEGFSLTWSYSTSGLGSIATISQADNVFTITPSTNSANAGSFTLTISATDGVNGAVSASSTLTLQFIIANSKYTTALITAVDTSDNNNITDASSNNHTITVTGDATAGTFSPYRHGGYSTYFDGSGDYLTPNSSAMNIGVGTEFTIEGWFYFTDIGGTAYDMLFGTGNTYYIGYRNNNNTLEIISSTNTIFDVSGGLNNNTWYHITIVRNSSNIIKAWINGVELSVSGGGSSTNNIALALTTIGRSPSYTTHDFKGYMRDIRFTNTTVYTSAFTPPTEPLTAISGTSLLTCHLPYIADGSSNNYTITPSGNVSTEPWSPYNYNSPYSANNNGGSIYFDGTGDWLRVTEIDFGTSDFCIEGWVYRESAADQIVFSGQTVSGGTTDNVQLIRFSRGGTGNHISTYFQNSYIFQDVSSDAVAPGQWFHCALTRSVGTIVRLFINGKIISTNNGGSGTSNSIGFSMVGAFDYDASPYSAFNGYVSDFKVTAGSAVYTADFTPPSSPLSSSGATLHIKGTDASIIDKAQTSNLALAGAASGSTTQVKFASTKSMYFDGNGDSLSITPGYDNTIYNFGTADWTIEVWAYIQTLSSGRNLISFLRASTNEAVPHFYTMDTGLRYYVNNADVITTPSVLSLNTWHHIALTRNGNDHKIFVDGTHV